MTTQKDFIHSILWLEKKVNWRLPLGSKNTVWLFSPCPDGIIPAQLGACQGACTLADSPWSNQKIQKLEKPENQQKARTWQKKQQFEACTQKWPFVRVLVLFQELENGLGYFGSKLTGSSLRQLGQASWACVNTSLTFQSPCCHPVVGLTQAGRWLKEYPTSLLHFSTGRQIFSQICTLWQRWIVIFVVHWHWYITLLLLQG